MINKSDRIKKRLQASIVSVSVLILLAKFTAFFITNSVGILTDALESIVNVVAGFIALISIHMASKPKDKDHPFGHGKIELISSSFEGLMIVAAGGAIIYEGVRRLFIHSDLADLDIGILIIGISGALNFIMGTISVRVGKKHNSMALIAGGKHLQSDTISTIGLILGLLIIYFTKIYWIDSVMALIFGSVIIYTGVKIIKKSVANLIDEADQKVLERILEVINKNRRDQWIDIHNAKVIKYGSHLYFDCDLTLPWFLTIDQGHAECVALRNTVRKELTEDVTLSIHSDSCNKIYCAECALKNCEYRKNEFVSTRKFTIKDITLSDEEINEYVGDIDVIS